MAAHSPLTETAQSLVGNGSADCSSSTIEKPHEWLRRNIGTRRALASRTAARLGSDQKMVLKADVVAATNRDLAALVRGVEVSRELGSQHGGESASRTAPWPLKSK